MFSGKYRKGDSFNFIQPYIRHHISFLLSNIKGAKGFYEKLNKNVLDMAFKITWHDDLQVILNSHSLQHAFKFFLKH